MKKYNLKKEHNWRGDIAELLAKHKYKAKRTKGYDFKPEPNFSKRQNAFLSRVWKSIDLYGCDDSGKLTIYEVKGKMHGVNGKPAITSTSLDAYRKARAKKIKVSLIIVTFHDNWEVSFSQEDFDEEQLTINDGGWYRRCGKCAA